MLGSVLLILTLFSLSVYYLIQEVFMDLPTRIIHPYCSQSLFHKIFKTPASLPISKNLEVLRHVHLSESHFLIQLIFLLSFLHIFPHKYNLCIFVCIALLQHKPLWDDSQGLLVKYAYNLYM